MLLMTMSHVDAQVVKRIAAALAECSSHNSSSPKTLSVSAVDASARLPTASQDASAMYLGDGITSSSTKSSLGSGTYTVGNTGVQFSSPKSLLGQLVRAAPDSSSCFRSTTTRRCCHSCTSPRPIVDIVTTITDIVTTLAIVAVVVILVGVVIVLGAESARLAARVHVFEVVGVAVQAIL